MSLFSDVLCRNLFRTVCVLIRTRLIFPRINGAILSVMTETGIEDGLRKLDTYLRLENSSQENSTTINFQTFRCSWKFANGKVESFLLMVDYPFRIRLHLPVRALVLPRPTEGILY